MEGELKKKLNWKEAEARLNRRIANLAIHPSVSSNMIIGLKLAPLRARFDNGERTEALYAEIEQEIGGK